MGDEFELEVVFQKFSDLFYQVDLTFHLIDELGNLVFVGSTALDLVPNVRGAGLERIICRVPKNLMHEGIYTIRRLIILKDGGTVLFQHWDALNFEIVNPGLQRLGWMGRSKSKEGIVRPKLTWEISTVD